MIRYYFFLGLRHLRRNPVLTALMVLTIAVGVAASMATLTVLHVMSGDPIPSKSDRLFVPLIEIRPDNGTEVAQEPPPMLTYRDAVNLHDAGHAKRSTALYGISPAIDSGRPDLPPFFGDGLAVHGDFFAMFEVPFNRGGTWSADDDRRGAHVVVLRQTLADKLFGATEPIGKTVRLGTQDHVVVGVISDAWQPLPKYYRMLGARAFGSFEDTFIPFTTAINDQLEPHGSMSCYDDKDTGPGFAGVLASECIWILYWVELDDAGAAPAYRDFLAGYVAEQRKLGRVPLPTNNRLYDVMGWLEARRVVANDAKLQTYLAFGFLLVCLVNAIGLLLAKFSSRAGEIGVRRALGASRRAVFLQYLIETGVLGLAGGVAGLGLAQLALWAIGSQSPELAALAKMDWVMLATTFALALGATLLAGLLPTWRASQVRPAVQLKSQ